MTLCRLPLTAPLPHCACGIGDLSLKEATRALLPETGSVLDPLNSLVEPIVRVIRAANKEQGPSAPTPLLARHSTLNVIPKILLFVLTLCRYTSFPRIISRSQLRHRMREYLMR